MGSQINIKDMSSETDDTPESKGKGKATPKRKTPPRSAKAENDLRDRLSTTFERIAASLEARGDDELSAIISEDAEVMAQGLVSLTRPLKPIRTVVLVFVAIVEPMLSFQRILRVLGRRFAERRMRAHERAQEYPETDTTGNTSNASNADPDAY